MSGSVIEAIAAVIDEMPSIGRDQHASQQQGGYAYRGIEAITKSAAPLFAKHGVVFVPQVIAFEIRDLLVNNKPWTDTILTVRYRICGPGGPEDYVEATVVGIGRDNSDKGANKAMTQAFKYALIQTLCISDERDDADYGSPEADQWQSPLADSDEVAGFLERVKAQDEAVRMTMNEWWRENHLRSGAVTIVQLNDARAYLAGLVDDSVPPVAPDAGTEEPLFASSSAAGTEPEGDASRVAASPSGYLAWGLADLKLECGSRELMTTGVKPALVERLDAWDALNGCPYDPIPERRPI